MSEHHNPRKISKEKTAIRKNGILKNFVGKNCEYRILIDIFRKDTTIVFDMVGKLNQLNGKRAFVAGFVLGYGGFAFGAVPEVPVYRPLEIPYLSGWTDRTKYDSRVAIGSNVATINKIKTLIESFASGKSFNTNQQVMIGYSLPLIYFAASLADATILKKILEDGSAVVTTETALGNTPMHFAAENSLECLKALIEDGRLDVNEHNYNGETPLYIAMKYNLPGTSGSAGQNQASVNALLTCPRIRVNSRDNKGRTMLHVAVMFGETSVVEQLLNLYTTGAHGEDEQALNIDIKDDTGRTPADYLVAIKNEDVRGEIQGHLATAGAKYGSGTDVTSP
jgi:hypothetical protein